MDEFLDDFLSPSSWPDMNTTGRSSWVDSTPGQTNGLLADPMGVFEAGEKNSTISMIPPSRIIGSLDGHTNDGSSAILVTGNSDYALDKRLFPGQTQQQQEAPDHVPIPSQHTNEPHESEFSLQRVIENSSSAGSHSIASMPSIWPSSYTTVSSLSPILGQGKLEGFGLQGELADGDVNLLGKRYIRDDKIPPLDNMSVASVNGQDELHNSHLSSFAVGSQVALARSAGLQLDQQLSQCSDANSMKQYMNHSSVAQLQPAAATGGGCNGAVRPRVRARRGQATDPHSIAERLRREKIAERMKNLQELVPNSNKTDKASMLDEIIDYVKFLQLQVKVLSMSRLGAAGAVVPLITDVQSEGSGSLLLSASVGQGADLTQSQENVECEQEVVKLMESCVTTAMQFLQNKGLCLMPIALASAISGGKTPSNNGMTHGITSLSSNSSAAGLRASSSCSESPTKENAVKNESREDAVSSGCNGAVAAVKQEEVHKASCNIREVKPKA